jgi:DNA polymerase-3 subunit delta'
VADEQDQAGQGPAINPVFDGIEGQAEATEILSRFLSRKSVPSSFLFHGREGTGKFLAARRFCAELIRQRSPEDARSDASPPPDLVVLDKGRDRIKIDEIQDLILRMNLKPFRAWCKVFLVNNAEKMTKEAANCLLKNLEEPPAATFIVLVTQDLNGMLATIRSRCLKVRFHRLPEASIERLLVSLKGLAPEAARQISILSEGSMASALELADEEAYAELRRLFDRAVGIWEEGPAGNAGRIMALASEFDKPDEREKLLFTKLLDIFYLYWRDVMAASLGVGGVKTVLGLPRYVTAAAGQARRVLDLIASVRDDLANNVNLRMALEYVLLETGRILTPTGEPHAASGRN